MSILNPYLVFKGNCEEAFNFYKSVFGGDFRYMGRYKDVPRSDREVYEADKKDIDSTATDKNQVTVGTINGGIIFTFKKDKGESIFFEAATE